jgi:hypothetical protein
MMLFIKSSLVALAVLLTAQVEARGSEIGYLKRQHAVFTADFIENGARSIEWQVHAPARAIDRLVNHLAFMKSRLERGRVVRAWDKFFVLDAALFPYYDMDLTRAGRQNLVIHKWADNDCAYEVVRTHAHVVRSEFFAHGDLSNDHSAIADAIIALPACDTYRDELNAFIAQHWTGSR